MSVTNWSMDVAILVTRIEERMSCYDILSKTWVQVTIFVALFLGWLAYAIYLDRKFVNEHKELAHDESPRESLRFPAHDEHDSVDGSVVYRRAA